MKEKFAFVSFLLGVSSITIIISLNLTSPGLIFELLVILFIPLSLIFGALGLKSKRRGLAITGMILSMISPLIMIFLV